MDQALPISVFEITFVTYKNYTLKWLLNSLLKVSYVSHGGNGVS
jgi:hypothetical protein